jgi:phosphohistidine swiveling domain-containing protein
MKKTKQIYKKIFNRALFLMACENYDLGERVELFRATDRRIFFEPLFIYEVGRGIDIYYNFSDPKQSPERIISYYNNNESKLLDLKKRLYPVCDKVRKLIKKGDIQDFKKLFKLTARVWPLATISNMLGDDSRDNVQNVKVALVKEYREIRKYSDGVLQLSHDALLEMAKKIVSADIKKDLEFIRFDEINNGNYPNQAKIIKRRKGYIYHKGKLLSGLSKEKYAGANNIELEGYAFVKKKKEDEKINGRIAYKGKVKGAVVIVRERKDFAKVRKGDILITAMTTPEMAMIMRKAAAFITDEGGITCHAAIVAREFKKPCIIGTGNATQILKDGDLVEVDAEKGVVRKI